MPFAGVSTDIISGFPGETQKDANDTINFIDILKPSRMHVFPYSDRSGTKAFELKDKIRGDIVKSRVMELIEIIQIFIFFR